METKTGLSTGGGVSERTSPSSGTPFPRLRTVESLEDAISSVVVLPMAVDIDWSVAPEAMSPAVR